MDLGGSISIVTGGGSGLGEATARALAGAGSTVVVADRDGERAERVAAEVGGAAALVDIADPAQVAAVVDAAEQLGPIRALVNCAGIAAVARSVDKHHVPADIGRFERVVRINLVGTYAMTVAAAAAMSKLDELPGGGRGAVVNTASAAAFEGQIGQTAYAASKAGVAGVTLPLARDLAVHGVRVNTIAPGIFNTPMFGGGGGAADKVREALAEDLVHPRRLGLPTEFATMALALLTNDYMNGSVIRLDGALRLPPR